MPAAHNKLQIDIELNKLDSNEMQFMQEVETKLDISHLDLSQIEFILEVKSCFERGLSIEQTLKVLSSKA